MQFSGVKAVEGVEMAVSPGEVIGLIGPNGAGKTTFVNVLTGFQRVDAGTVRVGDVDVTAWSPVALARAGIARTFQSVRLFGRLSVRENVEAAALGAGLSRRDARMSVAEVLRILDVDDMRDARAGALPSGAARRVGVARSLAMRPQFLLLDEPAAGLNEVESDQLLEAINEYRKTHEIGIVLIEHDMRVIMRISDRLHVLDHGRTLAAGPVHEVRHDPAVVAAYMGRNSISVTDE